MKILRADDNIFVASCKGRLSHLRKVPSCLIYSLVVGSLFLSGCSQVKQTLGLDRDPPDEFSVAPRAEISLPPEYNLMPPKAGSSPRGDVAGGTDPRPQEIAPHLKAKNTLFGIKAKSKSTSTSKSTLTQGEKSLLKSLRSQNPVPYEGNENIRDILDEEAGVTTQADKTWVQRVLYWQKPNVNKEAIDPSAEYRTLYGVNRDGTHVSPG